MVAWALVVGINQYPAKTGLSELQGAVADAVDFAEWALDPGAGGVDPANLLFWTHPAPPTPGPLLAAYLANIPDWPGAPVDFGRGPTSTEVKLAARDLALAAGQSKVDRLYIFFAGHGVQTNPNDWGHDPQTCFAAANFELEFSADGVVPCDDMRRMAMNIGAREVIIFLDCCRTDLPYRQPVAFGGEFVDHQGFNECCGVGSAAAPGSRAFETPKRNPNRGAFSKLLVFALRQVREDGRLTAVGLENYLKLAIGPLVSPDHQNPIVEVHPHGHDLVIVEAPPYGPDPRIIIDGTVLGEAEAYLLWPDRSRSLIDLSEVVPIPAPVGAYAIEIPKLGIEKFVHHFGPEDTLVGLP
jgi:hypothetical protein